MDLALAPAQPGFRYLLSLSLIPSPNSSAQPPAALASRPPLTAAPVRDSGEPYNTHEIRELRQAIIDANPAALNELAKSRSVRLSNFLDVLRQGDRREKSDSALNAVLTNAMQLGFLDVPEFKFGAATGEDDKGRFARYVAIRASHDTNPFLRNTISSTTKAEEAQGIWATALQSTSCARMWTAHETISLRDLATKLSSELAVAFSVNAGDLAVRSLLTTLRRQPTLELVDGRVRLTVSSNGSRAVVEAAPTYIPFI